MGTENADAFTEALNRAIGKRDLSEIRRLVDAGADPNRRNSYPLSPVERAAWEGFADALRLFVERGANLHPHKSHPNAPTLLQLAAQSKSVGTVRVLLDAGLPVDETGSRGRTALASACGTFNDSPATGQVEIIAELLARGASVRARDAEGHTPLHWAAMFGFADAVPVLAGHGAAIDPVDNAGYTPLFYAAKIRGEPNSIIRGANRPSLRVVEALLAAGANVLAAPEPKRITVLHAATEHAPVAVLELLLKRGADVNALNRAGRTPLALALSRPDVFTVLLAAGADIAPLLKTRKPALMTAAESGNLAAVPALIAAGADASPLYFGRTPLHRAIQKANVPIIAALLAGGANYLLPDKNGVTALDLARKRRRKAVAALLETASLTNKKSA